MPFKTLFLFFILGLMNSGTNPQSDPALTLNIPPEGLQIVQQQAVHSGLRIKNPLYLPARAITEAEMGSPALIRLVDSMYALMLKKAGVGIAANQVGKRLQIFIIEAKADNPRYQVLGKVPKQVFLNPRITKTSQQRSNF